MMTVRFLKSIFLQKQAKAFCVAVAVMCLPIQSPAGLWGRRHHWGGPTGQPVQPPVAPTPTGPNSGGGSEPWAGPVGATVDLNVKMPAWTKGWLLAGVSWKDTRQLDEAADINGRDIEAESHHALLVRTKASEKGPHSWKGKELIPGEAWNNKVYQESWASIDDLSGYSAGGSGDSPSGEDEEYERFSTFVKWSD